MGDVAEITELVEGFEWVVAVLAMWSKAWLAPARPPDLSICERRNEPSAMISGKPR
jgi:hypothetical protein